MESGNESKNEVYVNNNTNLLITMYSCAMVPLIAHLMELFFKDINIWSTERLLLLYLASVSGYIISDKLFRVLRKSKYYDMGFKLGNSDAMGIAICMSINSMVVMYYDSVATTIVLSICVFLSIVILSHDINKIRFDYRKLIIIGIYTVMFMLLNIKNHFSQPLSWWIRFLIIQFIVCSAFDLIIMLINKLKSSK